MSIYLDRSGTFACHRVLAIPIPGTQCLALRPELRTIRVWPYIDATAVTPEPYWSAGLPISTGKVHCSTASFIVIVTSIKQRFVFAN